MTMHSNRSDEVTVESIMRDRGIGKRQAYAVMRQITEEAMLRSPVPTNQREYVLATLATFDHVVSTAELMHALQQDGISIDGHDTTKVLWSLQKTGHVRFRERQKPKSLYAIGLTAKGLAAANEIAKREHVMQSARDLLEEITTPQPVTATIGAMAAEIISVLEPEPEPEIEPTTTFPRPWPAGSLAGWDNLRDVRDRYIKSQKLNAAAKLLEEVGEDYIAVSLYDMTKFSPLEEEVISLLRYFGEVE